MVEKAGQAEKWIKFGKRLIFDYHLTGIVRGSMRGVALFRQGRAFVVRHNKKLRTNMLVRQKNHFQKKALRKASMKSLWKNLKLILFEQKILFRCALLIQKRYF